MHTYRLTQEQIERVREITHAFTPEGFIWYWYITQDEGMPRHVVKWTYEYFEALKNGEALCLECFRGSLKTTFIANLSTYLLGCMPWLENMFIQAGDAPAEENTSYMSSVIEDNPGWKILFPFIQPDGRKWGAEGYEIQDTSLHYGNWRRKRTKVPSIIGGGYKSSIILGKHPRGHFVRDDVNNYKNTRSARELKAVKDIVFKEMGPAADRSKMEIDVFTPWVTGDVGDVRKKLPNVRHVRTPVYELDDKGRLTTVPAWPEVFDEPKIQELRDKLPPVEFAQMYLCDIEATKGQTLKGGWIIYVDSDKIKFHEWPVYIGIDYASVRSKQELRGRDYFAMAKFLLSPEGYLVLVGGYRDHVTRAEAEEVALNWGNQAGDNMRKMGIEKVGKGEEFANWMLLNAPFRVKEQGVANKSKETRFETELAQVFRQGKVRVSDEPSNPFIQQFLAEWLAWDGTEAYSDDCLDAVWHGVVAGKTFIRLERNMKKAETGNPYAGFAA